MVELTDLLTAWNQGDEKAGRELIQQVFADLRRMARQHMARERPDHTLEPTELVHEVFLRFAQQERFDWSNRRHFFGACQRMMRRILVDHARRHGARKRGDGVTRSLEELDSLNKLTEMGSLSLGLEIDEMLALSDALEKLEQIRERQARIVELRYFVGLSIEEVAQLLNLGPRTVKQDWTQARAWLFRALSGSSTVV